MARFCTNTTRLCLVDSATFRSPCAAGCSTCISSSFSLRRRKIHQPKQTQHKIARKDTAFDRVESRPSSSWSCRAQLPSLSTTPSSMRVCFGVGLVRLAGLVGWWRVQSWPPAGLKKLFPRRRCRQPALLLFFFRSVFTRHFSTLLCVGLAASEETLKPKKAGRSKWQAYTHHVHTAWSVAVVVVVVFLCLSVLEGDGNHKKCEPQGMMMEWSDRRRLCPRRNEWEQ